MKALARSQKGIAATEFALLAIPLFALIMGSLEIAMQMYNKAHVEGVLRQAARMSVTGDISRTGKDGVLIDKYVRDELSFTPGTEVDIKKVYYDDFSQVGQPEKRLSNATEAPYCFIDVNGNQRWDKDPARVGTGGADDIIDYQVKMTYNALFPLVTNIVTGEDTVSVSAQTTLRNEPFAGSNDMQHRTCCVLAAAGNPVTCEG